MQFTLARLPWAAQAGVGLGVSAACAACFSLFWAAPVNDELAARERALATAHRDLAAAVDTEKRLPEGRRAVAALGVRLEALWGTAARDADGPLVLREVQALAEESGLWITGFKPAPPANRESMTEWSVALEFDGTYASVVAFLQRVADDSRLLGASALRLRAHERPDEERTLTGACRLTTFVPTGALAAEDVGPVTASPVRRPGTGGRAPAVPRDPFVRPADAADATPAQSGAASAPSADGLAGLSDDQLTVRGVLMVDGRAVALAEGPDKRHYVIRPGDRLRDGVVQAVVPGGLVVVSDIPSPDRDGAVRPPRTLAIVPHGGGQ